jgi:multiple sugar transport system substrate-binding protein
VNEYEAEAGVVYGRNHPADFQTKALPNSTPGLDYDMIVGDSQWLSAASKSHYVDLTEFFRSTIGEVMAQPRSKYYAEYGGKYWAVPAEAPWLGLSPGLVQGRPRWRPSRKYGAIWLAVPQAQLRHCRVLPPA